MPEAISMYYSYFFFEEGGTLLKKFIFCLIVLQMKTLFSVKLGNHDTRTSIEEIEAKNVWIVLIFLCGEDFI